MLTSGFSGPAVYQLSGPFRLFRKRVFGIVSLAVRAHSSVGRAFD